MSLKYTPQRTRPDHPICQVRRENRKLKEDNQWLSGGLFFTGMIAGVLAGGLMAMMSVAGVI